MRVFAGKVKGGVVVLDGPGDLTEGARVVIVVNDGETSFTASPEEAQLLAALADEDRGTKLDRATARMHVDIGTTLRKLAR